MIGSRVIIVEAPRPVPKFDVGQHHIPLVINGKEFLVDNYGGKLEIRRAKECGVIIERVL